MDCANNMQIKKSRVFNSTDSGSKPFMPFAANNDNATTMKMAQMDSGSQSTLHAVHTALANAFIAANTAPSYLHREPVDTKAT